MYELTLCMKGVCINAPTKAKALLISLGSTALEASRLAHRSGIILIQPRVSI